MWRTTAARHATPRSAPTGPGPPTRQAASPDGRGHDHHGHACIAEECDPPMRHPLAQGALIPVGAMRLVPSFSTADSTCERGRRVEHEESRGEPHQLEWQSGSTPEDGTHPKKKPIAVDPASPIEDARGREVEEEKPRGGGSEQEDDERQVRVTQELSREPHPRAGQHCLSSGQSVDSIHEVEKVRHPYDPQHGGDEQEWRGRAALFGKADHDLAPRPDDCARSTGLQDEPSARGQRSHVVDQAYEPDETHRREDRPRSPRARRARRGKQCTGTRS